MFVRVEEKVRILVIISQVRMVEVLLTLDDVVMADTIMVVIEEMGEAVTQVQL